MSSTGLSAPPKTLIEVKDLHLSYPDPSGQVIALRQVSFKVTPGERIAIIGRSGSGKSSLLRCLGGLLAPTQGAITLDDGAHPIHAPKPARSLYSRVGLVFQDYGLVKQLSPLQNVLCGKLHAYPGGAALSRFKPQDRERAQALLTELGLGDRLHLRSSRLSGGEQQRVGIARLLLQDPEIILLDEPIASLDIHWAERALELLRDAHQGRATTFVILHDLEMAKKWATRALLIDRGQLLFDGDPQQACERLEALTAPQDQAAIPAPATPQQPSPLGAEPNPLHTPGPPRAAFYVMILIALIALYIWAILGINLDASKIFGSADKAADFIGRLLPPDTSVTTTVGKSILETIQIALLGTTSSIFTALPLAMLAAHNVSPPWLRWPARLLLNTMRTIPSIIWGLFFVAIVGLGPLPGVLALTFYATGYLGKFYYEGIESIDPKPLVSLKTVGASPLQSFRWGIFPQLLPLFTSYTLYMFEYNVRAASILGIVGAGGIGFYLHSYINNFVYTKATTALLMLLALVTLIDASSGWLRKRLAS